MTQNRHPNQNRQSTRLRGWDYTTAGAYFVTICTYQRKPVFGQVVDGVMRLNDWGSVVVAEWRQTEQLRDYVALDEFVVMPNHVHGIIWIQGYADTDVGARRVYPQVARVIHVGARHASPLRVEWESGVKPKSLGAIVGSFKSAVTKTINDMRQASGITIWQRNYYDRIVRDDDELNAIRHYIRQNPANWSLDRDVVNEIENLSFG